MLGDVSDAFQLLLSDIRNPGFQSYPPLWYDCWSASILLDGECAIGDWMMTPGDVAIIAPGVEYGPIQAGPSGAQTLKVVARLHMGKGCFGLEHRDHPMLAGTTATFMERPPHNRHNEGRAMVPVDGLDGLVRGRLAPGAAWDLGEPGDPERGQLRYVVLAPGETLQPRRFHDWSALVMLGGGMQLGSQQLVRQDILTLAPGSRLDAVQAGPDGMELLEVLRTAPGPGPLSLSPIPVPDR